MICQHQRQCLIAKKTLQEFKSSKVEQFLNEANKSNSFDFVNISTTLAVFCSNTVQDCFRCKLFQGMRVYCNTLGHGLGYRIN